MHDVLRSRLMRRIESLPEAQVYQVLDYIEFLESKYGVDDPERPAGGLQRLAENIEDRIRKRSISPSNLREAFQVLAAADRAMDGVARAGRQILDELSGGAGEGKDGPGRRKGGSEPRGPDERGAGQGGD